ncbi:O-fucosyltransferase 20-like [Musa acuminata AAA Group]|uniref:O-fucosyltransferase 20-like n=1 Tax=Musa acuminata AAA Group TaxID=214697 RepID=UPI0031E4346E
MARSKTKQLSYIAVPSQFIHSLHGLHLSPKKAARFPGHRLPSLARNPKFLLLLLFFLLALLRTVRIGSELHRLLPFPSVPCSHSSSTESAWAADKSAVVSVGVDGGDVGEVVGEFWRQPDGMGYSPCLNFSEEFRMESEAARGVRRRKYLLVVVSGGLNQQRNQIVDAVVIARILGAALVVPVLQVNVIWGDESEFSDIFDLEHFKRVLADDVKVVSSLPSTHIRTRPVDGKQTPLNVPPSWIRNRFLKKLNREGVLLLRGLDSRLSKDLPRDLQKLRCKVAFHALRFAAPIQELGNKLAMRMRSKGPYLALHLRLERDVWVRTGCLPGLSSEYDEIIQEERKLHPKLLTGRSNMTYHERKLAGFCPLNALEVTRLLKALGAPPDAMIYWAGGEPFGGPEALLPLTREFPHLYNKENLSLPGELEPFAKKASLLAAIDYIVCEQSDVFMPSHGGNMGHLMQGHRAFAGHRKFITPNKRQMLPYFLDASLPELEFHRIIKELHRGSLGQPEWRSDKVDKDVTAFPAPECMCNGTSRSSAL